MTHDLSLERDLPLSPTDLWPILTEPAHLEHWFFPDGIEITASDFDPARGGNWTTDMRATDGTEFTVTGRFQSIDCPRTFSFTHGWVGEAGEVATETLVTLTLHETEAGTRLVLTQRGLTSAESVAGHSEGWAQTLEHLHGYVTRM